MANSFPGEHDFVRLSSGGRVPGGGRRTVPDPGTRPLILTDGPHRVYARGAPGGNETVGRGYCRQQQRNFQHRDGVCR
jgi:hypothetical protein